jgi:dienelactone hydrolase
MHTAYGVALAMALLAGMARAGEDGISSGPWDLAALRQVPQVTWVQREGMVRSLYYANEPYHGKPTRVFAYYAVPERRQGKVPAMVLVHGGGGKAFPDWAELWAKRGYAAIAMDLSGNGPDGKRLPDGGPAEDHHFIFEVMSEGLRETWPYQAVAAVIRGCSALAAQPEVDAERIGITGISWGGYLTCIVAGLDDRLKVAIPVYGCGFLLDNSAWLPNFQKMPAAERAQWAEKFEPSRYLAHARMPMLWLNGTNDFAYPLDSYQRSYRLPRGPRTLCVTVRMPHGHGVGWAPVEIGLFADWHLRGGVAFPEIGPMRVGDGGVEATFKAPAAIKSGGLHFTTDTVTWNQRNWQSAPAEIAGDRVKAKLPAGRPLAFFLTITDSRGVTVSAEHSELPR